MEKIKRKQGQGFDGIFTFPETLTGRTLEFKIVNVQSDKSILTISGDDVVIVDNVASFSVADSQTLTWSGDYKVQIFVNGLTYTDDTRLLTPIILYYEKTY